MEKTDRDGEKLPGGYRTMDGRTTGDIVGPHAVRACHDCLSQAERRFQVCERDTDLLRSRVSQSIRSRKSGRYYRLLGRGATGMENVPGGELYGMETYSVVSSQ